MTANQSVTGVKRIAPSLAAQQIQRLVRERLLGRKIDGVAFMEELLIIAQRVGEVRCRPAGDHGLHFELPGHESFEVDVDVNRGKLRMLCARLAVLCQESGGEFMLYGGEGVIRKTGKTDLATDTVEWKARWTNTPGSHEFTIQHSLKE